MNLRNDDFTSLETLIRSRTGRLSKPDPAWRESILAVCETVTGPKAGPQAKAAAPPAPANARRRWLTSPCGVTAWGSLAACWLAVLTLNHETRQLNASVSAGTALGSPSSIPAPAALATLSSLPPGSGLLLLQPDPAILTFLQNSHPRSAPSPPPARRPPPHSSQTPVRPLPAPFV